MTIDAKLAARTRYKCDACGNIGFEYQAYTSIAHDETCPDEVPHACCDECAAVIKNKVDSGAWTLPKLHQTPGYFVISKPRKGY